MNEKSGILLRLTFCFNWDSKCSLSPNRLQMLICENHSQLKGHTKTNLRLDVAPWAVVCQPLWSKGQSAKYIRYTLGQIVGSAREVSQMGSMGQGA